MTLIIVYKSLKTHSPEFNIYALCSPRPVFLAVGRLALLLYQFIELWIINVSNLWTIQLLSRISSEGEISWTEVRSIRWEVFWFETSS